MSIVCHEHIEYYRLRDIQWMCERSDLEVVDVELNDVNGGSFSVLVQPKGAAHSINHAHIATLLRDEDALALNALAPYDAFRKRVFAHRDALRDLLSSQKIAGKRVAGLGASTKGNVLLQFCGIGPELLPVIGEVNSDKFGCFTPGSRIPIASETEVRDSKPDAMLVLPWHFREGFLKREQAYLSGGGKLIFPLPEIEVVGS